MSKSNVAHMLLFPSVVLLPAHHQIVVLQCQTLTRKASVWFLETVVMECCEQKLVLDPQSLHFALSVHLNAQSLLALITLLIVVSLSPMHVAAASH